MFLKLNKLSEGGAKSEISGLGVSFRVASFYAVFFILASYGLFAFTYFFILGTTKDAEIEAINERILDYRIWYREGGFEAVGARFLEQTDSEPDVFFLRIGGEGKKAVLYSNPRSQSILNAAEVAALDPGLSGFRLKLGSDVHNSWTVVADELAPGLKIQVGKSNYGGEAVIRRFKKIFSYFFIPTLLIGLVGGVFVGFQAMLPIRRLAKVIRKILATGDLEQRASTESEGNELNDLCLCFNELLEKNQRLVQVIRNSLDNTSHDLRTPLARLRATLEQALAGNATTETMKDACGEGIESCDDLLTMLQALMESSEAESGVMRLAEDVVLVDGLIETASELYDFVAEERDIVIQRKAPPGLKLRCDRARMLRLLANLIDNAAKFSAEGKTVSVSAGVDDGVLILKVSNTGVVIQSEELPRIWERLYRGDQSRSTRGLGLGLSFVKAIAEAHGGTVSATSSEKDGTTFVVTLPERLLGE